MDKNIKRITCGENAWCVLSCGMPSISVYQRAARSVVHYLLLGISVNSDAVSSVCICLV